MDKEIYKYEKSETGITIHEYCGFDAEVVVPASIEGSPVIGIGRLAFKYSKEITSLVLPESLKFIEKGAFSHCRGLTSLALPKSLIEIGEQAFLGCTNLQRIEIPERVECIGVDAFALCSNIHDVIFHSACDINKVFHEGIVPFHQIAESLQHMELGRFDAKNRKQIILVHLKNTERDIPEAVWEMARKGMKDYVIELIRTEHIPGLTRLLALKKPTAMQLDNYVAEAKAVNHPEINALLLEYSKGISQKEKEKAIERKLNANPYAVAEMKKLWKYRIDKEGNIIITGYKGTEREIEIPPIVGKKRVVGIGKNVFRGCASMTSITIPETVVSIGERVFERCSSLISVVIPDGVTEIAQSTFYGCHALTSVSMPDTVTRIGERAFYGCNALNFVGIPANVTRIGERAFCGCTSLTNVTIPVGISEIPESTFSRCSSLTSIAIPESVTEIGVAAFYDCNSLTDVVMPEGIRILLAITFCGCSSLTSVEFPASIKYIANGTFSNCNNLTMVEIPRSVEEVGEFAFPEHTVVKKKESEKDTENGKQNGKQNL